MSTRSRWAVLRLRAPSVLTALIVALAVVAVVAAFAPAVDVGANRDSIATWTDIIRTVAIVGAAVLSYYRFSLNRTFTARANLVLDVHTARSPSGEAVHSLVVKVHNIGVVTLVAPHVTVSATARKTTDLQQAKERLVLEVAADPSAHPDTIETVEPDESATYLVQTSYPPDTWLVTYEATVALHNQRSWTEYLTVDCAPRDAIPR